MCGSSRSVVSNDGVLAQRNANAGDLYVSVQSCDNFVHPHLLSHLLHMSYDKIIAIGMEQSWEAPGVLERDKMRLLWVVVEVNGPKGPNLLPCHLRAVDTLLERRRE